MHVSPAGRDGPAPGTYDGWGSIGKQADSKRKVGLMDWTVCVFVVPKLMRVLYSRAGPTYDCPLDMFVSFVRMCHSRPQ